MRQFNIEIDKTSPKTSRFVVPANEHFSILVRYKNWEDKQEWLDYTLVDDAGADIVKYKKEAENDSALYFCGIMDTSTNLRFKTSTLASTLAPRDTIQIVAIASSTQDNCYICSADYARTAGDGGGGGGGVSKEYVDTKVQEEADARDAAIKALSADIPTKTSELSNDSGYLTNADTIDNSLSAGFASYVPWSGVQNKQIASATELGLVKVGSNLTIDADGKLNAVGGGTGGVSQEYVDGKVQEEATARQNADEQLRAAIPTKTSQLSNDSGFLTTNDTIANADHANTANTADNVNWSGVQSKPTTLNGYGITDAATKTELDSLAAVVGTANTQLEEIA